ncbi:putative pH-induced membrane-bound redox modulator [Escherichia coli]|nr:putative pH-induced membrane-bound redox modulator [Escherichia coli]
MTDTIDNEHFFVRKNGLLYATPLMLVLILVELSDVISPWIAFRLSSP